MTDESLVLQSSKLEQRVKSGAGWFFWIAALSFINSIMMNTGANYSFIIGLGITQIIDAMAAELGTGGKIVAILLDLAVAGVFVLFGIFGKKRHQWAFVLGGILYLLDTLLYLTFQDWLGLAFHAFALFCIFSGLSANKKLQQLESTIPQSPPPITSQPIG
jgi:hypothetical protein